VTSVLERDNVSLLILGYVAMEDCRSFLASIETNKLDIIRISALIDYTRKQGIERHRTSSDWFPIVKFELPPGLVVYRGLGIILPGGGNSCRV
jgi:hypothetical protein